MEPGTYVIGWTAEGEPVEADAHHLPDRWVSAWVDELAELVAWAPTLDAVSFAAMRAAMRESGLSVPES